MRLFGTVVKILFFLIVLAAAVYSFLKFRELQMMQKIVERLTADSRIAEVMVTDVKFDPLTQKTYTTIKFLEYDTELKPLPPKYFTFSSDIIQFQSLVIRFDDYFVKTGHPLKGKSAYLFMKVFTLGDKRAEVCKINIINEIPSGYVVEGAKNSFEKKIWEKFWQYALNPQEAKKIGVKNLQVEAPGTKFVPGMIYTIKIEHDGGMRIDAQPLPEILKKG